MNKEINPDILHLIIPFLEMPDIAHCQLVSKSWNSVVKSPSIWRSISDISDKNIKRLDLFHPWLISKIRQYKPKKILIYDRESLWSPSEIFQIFDELNENLEKLKLFLELEEEDASLLIMKIVKNCPNLICFKTHGKFLSDTNMNYFKDLKFLGNFAIYNDDPGFTGMNLKNFLPLKKLFLRPHNVEFEALMPIIDRSKLELKKLCFDCEIFEQKQLSEVLNKLNCEKIETVMLNYCDKFDEEVLKHVIRFKKLKTFKFSKGISIQRESYLRFLNQLDCQNLVSLNLKECSEIRDDSIFVLAEKAKNLKKLNLSWCAEITSASINEIFMKCNFLKKVHLTGIKQLDRKAFPFINEILDLFNKEVFLKKKMEKKKNFKKPEEYFKEGWNKREISCYRFLKYLDLRSCDLVADEVLMVMKIIFPSLRLVNYYGEEVNFIS